jgi:formamidopyrimidine-DNA glycosylase
MPELPEVQTVVTTLIPTVVGRRVTRVQLRRRDILTPPHLDFAATLRNRKVSDITRRGKRIIFLLESAERFFIHLGMTGRLTVERTDAPIQPHTHLLIDLSPAREKLQLRFRDQRRFGGIFWIGRGRADENIGPEPLLIRPSQLSRRLLKTTRAIKTALLDQTVIAGLGNIYVDEALFAARIHPLTRACDITQLSRLCRAIKLTLRRALRHRGSTLRDYVDANGSTGRFQNLHRVYDRAAHPCHTCKTPIARLVLGGRSTHFCPRCQPRRQSRRIL